MRITTEHPASKFGWPVILDDAGELMDSPVGVRAIRDRLGLTQDQLAKHVGLSYRSVQTWEQGQRPVPCNVLYVMKGLLEVQEFASEKGEGDA